MDIGPRTIRWWVLGLAGCAALGTGGLVLNGQDAVREDAVLVQLERQANAFFDGLTAGETEVSLDTLLAGSQIALRTELVGELKAKAKELESRYGRCRGFERLETRRIGQDVILYRYLLKCENYPVLWRLTFYRTTSSGESAEPPRDNWKLISLKFDTELEALAR